MLIRAKLNFAHACKLFIAGSIATASAQLSAQDTELSFTTTKISDHIYILSGQGGFTGGNVGLTVGDDGIAMIDNGVPSVIDILRAEIAKTSDQPIDYLINTHVHGDHIGNNQHFGGDGTRIISHENLRASLVKNGVGRGDKFEAAPAASIPVLTFSDKMTIHLNGDAAKIIHFSNAHTDGDAIVKFENANVIHTGDIMFNGMFPFIDGNNGGSLNGVIDALKGIAELSDDSTKIIPGHGPLASKADINKTVAMLEDAKSLVAKLVADGKTDEEIQQANPLSKYEDYNWQFITTEKMTTQVIAGVREG